MIIDDYQVGTKPLVTPNPKIHLLEEVQITVVRGKDGHTKAIKVDLYEASDAEFTQYLIKQRHAKQEELDILIDEANGWLNSTRIALRISLIEHYS